MKSLRTRLADLWARAERARDDGPRITSVVIKCVASRYTFDADGYITGDAPPTEPEIIAEYSLPHDPTWSRQ